MQEGLSNGWEDRYQQVRTSGTNKYDAKWNANFTNKEEAVPEQESFTVPWNELYKNCSLKRWYWATDEIPS